MSSLADKKCGEAIGNAYSRSVILEEDDLSERKMA